MIDDDDPISFRSVRNDHLDRVLGLVVVAGFGVGLSLILAGWFGLCWRVFRWAAGV